MIRPLRSHDALLSDIHSSDRRDGSFRVVVAGTKRVSAAVAGHPRTARPVPFDSLTRKYNQTDKPHVRMTKW